MSERFLYFDVVFAIEVHDKIIEKSGGMLGVRDEGLILSTLEHLKNGIYYPELEDKLTHILFSFNKNHCFTDGNKRSSIALAAYFLEINGLDDCVDNLILRMENFVVDIANNNINKELLKEIVYSILYEDDFSEELKIKIIHAKENNK